MKTVTLDSLDDDLWETKNKEIHKLKAENDKLRLDLSRMTDSKKEWNNKFNNLLESFHKLEQENLDLEKKLLHYEHDPIKMTVATDCIDIEYWNIEKNDYDIFATFYTDNVLEPELEEFCREFVLELKDAYLVE